MFKKFFIYPLALVHYNPSLTFYEPLRNNSESYVQTKSKPFYFRKFVITLVKGLWLVTEMQECPTVFFHRKKQRTIAMKCVWKLIFVIFSHSTWDCRHAKHVSHVGTWARKARKAWGCEHVDIQDTLAREHVSTQGTLARQYLSTQDTLAREDIRTEGTLAREHLSRQGTLALEYVRQAI